MPGDPPSPARDARFPEPIFRAGWVFAGRFHLETCVGRGGMGVVWRAQDQVLQQTVALKFLPEWLLWDEAALADLRREAQRLHQLSHPGIVRLHDLHQDEGLAALVMEYVDGLNLAQWRGRHPEVAAQPDLILAWLPDLCQAIHFAHSRGIVHRDLKPANLLLSHGGEIKISDFGLAETVSLSLSRTSRSTGGTIAYMSPQHVLGEPPAPADDLYSLGSALFEILTGKPPFYSGSIETQIREIPAPRLHDRLPESSAWPAPLLRRWESALAACLEKDPHRRPADALALARGLAPGEAAAGAPVAWTGLRPNRRWALPAVAAVGLGLSAYLGFRIWTGGPPESARPPEAGPVRRSPDPSSPPSAQPAAAELATGAGRPSTAAPTGVPEARLLVGYQARQLVLHAPLDGNGALSEVTPGVGLRVRATQPAADRFGRAGGALRFSGESSATVDLGPRFHLSSAGAFSWCAWVWAEPDVTSSLFRLFRAEAPVKVFDLSLQSDGRMIASTVQYSTAQTASPERRFPMGRWTSLGMVWQNGRVRLYFDGEEVLEAALPTPEPFADLADWTLRLGLPSDFTNARCSAVLDDLRFYAGEFKSHGFLSQAREESPPEPVPEPPDWTAALEQYVVTRGRYAEGTDLDDAIRREFGTEARLADWREIAGRYGRHGREFAQALGLGYNQQAWVRRAEEAFFTPRRRYHVSLFDGPIPANYLVHDLTRDQALVLGSWFGQYPALVRLADTWQPGRYYRQAPWHPLEHRLRPGWQSAVTGAQPPPAGEHGWDIPPSAERLTLTHRPPAGWASEFATATWRGTLEPSPWGASQALVLTFQDGSVLEARGEVTAQASPLLDFRLQWSDQDPTHQVVGPGYGPFEWQLVVRPGEAFLGIQHLQDSTLHVTLRTRHPALHPAQIQSLEWVVMPGAGGTRLENLLVEAR